MERLVFGPAYRRIQSMVVSDEPLANMVAFERAPRELAERLEGAAQACRDEVHSWAVAGSVAVPDTNVLLHHIDDQQLDKVDWPMLADVRPRPILTVVILNTVVEELDRLKDRGQGDTRKGARRVLGDLDRLFPGSTRLSSATGLTGFRVEMDDLTSVPMQKPDREIIAQTLELVDRVPERDVTLVTADRSMAFRAVREGLRVTLLRGGAAPTK